MRTIQKRAEPKTLTEHRAGGHATYANYTDTDGLRRALVEEQRGICCYCMRRIRPDADKMKIEHWRAQSRYPGKQLAYRNLLGACLGNQGQPRKEQTCDTRKADADLSRNPANPGHHIEQSVHFLGNGCIKSPDSAFDKELNEVLNLNLPLLMRNRRSVLDALLKALPPAGPISRSRRRKIMDQWNGAGDGDLPEYCAVVTYWLRNHPGPV